MVPFGRLYTTFYQSAIERIALYFTTFELLDVKIC